MSGHTPGPWFEQGYSVYAPTPQDVPERGFRGFREPEIPGGYLIAESIPHDATRRLIAAAPDLLAALEGLMPADLSDFDEHPGDYIEEFHAARAAIVKAKGGAA
jgi:hypothetical protein